MICEVPKLATYKVVIAAHDVAMRQSLSNCLDEEGSCQILGECDNGADMIRIALAADPNVVIFDIGLPGCNGMEALEHIYKERPISAVAIASERDHDLVRKALSAFYLSYLVKPVEPHQVIPAIEVAQSRFEIFKKLEEENHALRQTLQNRKTIERAKGVLMQRNRWSEADAFRRLQRGAMNRRTTMVNLAEAVLSGKHVEL
jgi:two-component system, response regulator PdtaR